MDDGMKEPCAQRYNTVATFCARHSMKCCRTTVAHTNVHVHKHSPLPDVRVRAPENVIAYGAPFRCAKFCNRIRRTAADAATFARRTHARHDARRTHTSVCSVCHVEWRSECNPLSPLLAHFFDPPNSLEGTAVYYLYDETYQSHTHRNVTHTNTTCNTSGHIHSLI